MAERRHPAHADHDELLIAALAADDLTAAARSDAEDRLASCPDCAALHADLVAIAAATRALPAPARPRSFTLSPDQAARLRPPAWRRFTVGLRAPGGFARPLAATFTTLGVAGLLLTALPAAGPLALLGSSSGAAVQRQGGGAESTASPPVEGVPGQPLPAYGAMDGLKTEATPGPGEDVSAEYFSADGPRASTGGPSPLTVVSAGLLVTGAAMLVLVAVAGRRSPDDRGDGT